MALLSAVLTPTPDPLTMLLVLLPMLLLYELGIVLAWFATRGASSRVASSVDA
jgi:sec-independent protein translocase protein TatC